MRKFFALFLCVLSLVTLTSCGNPNPKGVMSIADGAFSITPQEYIDRINAVVADQNDSRYQSIPDYVESDAEIDIQNWYLTLKLTANDDGNLTTIQWDWDAAHQGTSDNMSLYLSAAVYMISPDEDTVATVFTELDMLDTAPPKYDTSYTVDGVQYLYSTFGHGQYNTITIVPDSED